MKQASGNSGSRKAVAGVSAAVRMRTMRENPGSDAERMQRIATAAYYRAEARGFAPGHELDDWVAAEAEMSPRALSSG